VGAEHGREEVGILRDARSFKQLCSGRWGTSVSQMPMQAEFESNTDPAVTAERFQFRWTTASQLFPVLALEFGKNVLAELLRLLLDFLES